MRFIYTKAFAIFSGCVILVAFFAFLQIKGYIGPIQSVLLQTPRPIIAVTRGITVPIKNFFSTVYNLHTVVNQNAELTQKVHEQQQQLVDLQHLEQENEVFKKELGFIAAFKQHAQPCTVLAQNPLRLTDTIALNCGTSSGISEGQAVVSQGYLVGKITYADRNASTALLVTNSQFSADAKLSKSGTTAIARGSFGSGLILDQLSQNEQLEKGALVVTAGINDQIPKNIIIGEVGELLSKPNDLFKKTTLISPIDFNNLEFVFVVNASS